MEATWHCDGNMHRFFHAGIGMYYATVLLGSAFGFASKLNSCVVCSGRHRDMESWVMHVPNGSCSYLHAQSRATSFGRPILPHTDDIKSQRLEDCLKKRHAAADPHVCLLIACLWLGVFARGGPAGIWGYHLGSPNPTKVSESLLARQPLVSSIVGLGTGLLHDGSLGSLSEVLFCKSPRVQNAKKHPANFFPPYPESPGSTAAVRYLGGVIPWNSSGESTSCLFCHRDANLGVLGSKHPLLPSHLAVNLAGNSDGFLDQSMLSRELEVANKRPWFEHANKRFSRLGTLGTRGQKDGDSHAKTEKVPL